MKSLTLRRATLEDLPTLVPLFDAYRQFYGQPPDLATAAHFLQARLERGESVVLLAEVGGQAVGFTQLYGSFSSVRVGRVWILNDLYVSPAARGRGAGAALLEAAADFARQDGALGLSLQTAHDNHTAQALYERLGWVRDTDFYTYTLTF
ncbi:ribosomal protein S18 acetylase RimI-like enzyme [Deinobacterium chartae]|uniref:Ribosomal protein S18 acetylase RimI-like enzyme n=1 Tax=Deinobacterium chartae TaxID=521158 RepID=A0A841I2R0_9DEIO|nr:GNAT family N-acetyltransferase [Deinobacterium chartae]MBB6099967.1 ribosomal protein S18 acetylase RimI-like enzyme [Deinobacterium chartae]